MEYIFLAPLRLCEKLNFMARKEAETQSLEVYKLSILFFLPMFSITQIREEP